MGNILSYLKWRGDLSFEEHPFCEADNLVLSALVYIDFSGIVTEKSGQEEISIKKAALQYVQIHGMNCISDNSCEQVLLDMADSRRFQGAGLSCYREKQDEEDMTQFAAMKVALEDGTCYLAFRGTDNSIVGWREDFSLSYQIAPAQKEAYRWLEDVMEEETRKCRVGGHSKGGNLAVYAASMCSDKNKEKILSIYNNDGPGICRELLEKDGYEQIRDRIIRIIPGFCIIGMLFTDDIPAAIVESSAKGILQHNLLTWQLSGSSLCVRESLETGCRFYNEIFDTWIESASMEQRKAFTRDFFDALGTGGATTMQQIAESGLDGFGTVLISIVKSESKTKIVIGKFLLSFWEGIRSGAVIVAGLLCMMLPELAVRSMGILLSLAGFFWSGRKILDYAFRENITTKEKQHRLIFYMGAMSLMVFLTTHNEMLLISGNLFMGVLFMGAAIHFFQKAKEEQKMFLKKAGILVVGILAFMLDCVSIVVPEQALGQKMLVSGSALILYGLGCILNTIFKEGKQGV